MDHRSPSSSATMFLAILAAGATFTWLGPVVRPFLVAVFVFYAIRSAAKWLRRLGLGFTVATISVVSLAAIFAILLTQLVHRETGVFLAKWPRYEQRIESLLDSLNLPRASRPSPTGSGRPPGEKAAVVHQQPAAVVAGEKAADPQEGEEDDATSIAEQTDVETTSNEPVPSPSPQPSLLHDFVGGGSKAVVDYVFRRSLSVAELLLLVIVYTIFLSLGWRRFSDRIVRAFPGEQGGRLLAIGEGIGTSMEKFMAVKTLVGAGMGLTAGIVMAFFRVDHWLLWTYLFFVANFVTSIGSMAACVPPIVVAFLGLASPVAAAAVSILLVVNRCVWIDFIEVRMAGRELSLDPVIVLLWLTYWGWAWGVIGLLLAYPMLAAVKIVLLHVKGYEGWATLIGDQ